jgi:hypothetical protein
MRRIRRLGLIPTLAALGCVSCGSEREGSDSFSVRDSAGVRIVGFSAPTAELRLADQPYVKIGQAEGESVYELFKVKSGFLAEDGRIVLANSGTSEIRIFDGSGRHLQSIGRPGEGPGEFRSLDWVEGAKDGRLVALDLDLRRITIFGPDGDVLSTFHVREGPGYPNEGPLLLPDGDLLLSWLQDDPFSQVDEGELRFGDLRPYPMVLTRHDPITRAWDTVAVVDGGVVAVFESNGGRLAYGAPWLGRLTTYAVGDDGIYIGTQRENEIRRLNFAGELEEIVRGPEVDLTVSQELIASYEEARLSMASARVRDDPELRRRALEELRRRPFAPSKPAYGRILLGPGRELWVSEWTIRLVLPKVWTVVNLESGRAASVTVPDRFELLQVGEGFLLGKWTDELGVETVMVYELESAD